MFTYGEFFIRYELPRTMYMSLRVEATKKTRRTDRMTSLGLQTDSLHRPMVCTFCFRGFMRRRVLIQNHGNRSVSVIEVRVPQLRCTGSLWVELRGKSSKNEKSIAQDAHPTPLLILRKIVIGANKGTSKISYILFIAQSTFMIKSRHYMT